MPELAVGVINAYISFGSFVGMMVNVVGATAGVLCSTFMIMRLSYAFGSWAYGIVEREWKKLSSE